MATTKIKKELMEHLVRECIQEIFNYVDNEVHEDTVGAPAPPADGLGTAQQPPIPKTKKAQLKELVGYIVSKTLNELDSTVTQTPDMTDPSMVSVDTMSPDEQRKLEREREHARRQQLKQSEEELKTSKKELDFQRQKMDQSKRLKIPALQKKIQALKK